MKTKQTLKSGIIFIEHIYRRKQSDFYVLCAKDWRGAEGVGFEKANEGTEPRKAWPMPFKAAEHPYI